MNDDLLRMLPDGDLLCTLPDHVLLAQPSLQKLLLEGKVSSPPNFTSWTATQKQKKPNSIKIKVQ